MNERIDHIIAMSGAVGLKDAVVLRDQMLAAIEAHAAVTVCADDLVSADLSIIQLLLSAQRYATRLGKTLRVTASPKGPLPGLFAQAGLVSTGTDDLADLMLWPAA